ncbi:MAG: ATP-binding cassette domain-containing protein [Caldilineaceae bacterium]
MTQTSTLLPDLVGKSVGAENKVEAAGELATLAWSVAALNEGVALLAQQAGLAAVKPADDEAQPLPAPAAADQATLSRWLAVATHQLGCDVQAVTWHFSDIRVLIQRAAPAILRIPRQTSTGSVPGAPEAHFLLLLKGGRRWVTLLAPNRRPVRVSTAKLTALLQTEAAGNLGEAVEQLLVNTGVAATRIAKAKTALIAEQMGSQRFAGCWLLKVAAHRSTWQHLRYNRLPRYLLLLVGLSLVQQLVTLISWRYIGQGVFQGEFTNAGLNAWALLLLTAIPLTLLANWAQINVTLNLSRFTRTRLLQGILNLNPADIRHWGAGQFLERVMQTESLQSLLIGGGFGVINALLQLIVAGVILRLGVGGNVHSALLLVWLLLTVGLSLWYAYRFIQWRDSYRALTNDLVERMVAHRTRLAQENKATWHWEEDLQLDHHHARTRRLDGLQRLLNALLNRGWFLVGLAGIALPFINGVDDPVPLAISIGGILLAGSAFAALRTAIVTLVDIAATWRDVGPIFHAAEVSPSLGKFVTPPGHPVAPSPARGGGRDQADGETVPPPNWGRLGGGEESALANELGADETSTLSNGVSAARAPTPKNVVRPLLVARHLQFRYLVDGPLTLDKIDLTIYPGDRLLLEGPSGGGKSTLASLLVGLQQPSSGLLLLYGLDQPTLGLASWRQRVVSAPQFHENHIFTETFGFNLLMGRRWPATQADLEAAEEICHELGLGDLLARMPGGMMQMVGESGWQLSHGERSRLFIARALLQEADLIVLDESFAALDPVNLERAITCVLKRAPTLLVIAHP